MTTIRFTAEKIGELRSAYDAAVAEQKASFMFDGHEYLTQYAKYLLQHLESTFVDENEPEPAQLGHHLNVLLDYGISQGGGKFCLMDFESEVGMFHVDILLTRIDGPGTRH